MLQSAAKDKHFPKNTADAGDTDVRLPHGRSASARAADPARAASCRRPMHGRRRPEVGKDHCLYIKFVLHLQPNTNDRSRERCTVDRENNSLYLTENWEAPAGRGFFNRYNCCRPELLSYLGYSGRTDLGVVRFRLKGDSQYPL